MAVIKAILGFVRAGRKAASCLVSGLMLGNALGAVFSFPLCVKVLIKRIFGPTLSPESLFSEHL